MSSEQEATRHRVPSTEAINVVCPADGRVVGVVPLMERAEVLRAAEDLRSVQPAWEALGADGRGRVLLGWLNWILDNERRLSELVQQETGRSWGDAMFEPLAAVELINFFAKNAEGFLAPRRVRAHNLVGSTKRLEVRYRPFPLVGVISPWNSPIGVPMMDVAPALMAGAAVLSKPSEVTPLAWTELVRGWNEEIGAPPVLSSATGDGTTGEAVVDAVDMVMFTGSTRTGRRIAARAGERLIPCSVELGGKDAMIVLDDADLDRAAGAAVWGAMSNAGQLCVSVERIYVQAGVHDEFVGKVSALVRQLRQGMDAPGSFSSDVGATATESQLAIISAHVDDAVAKGATALVGGRRGAGGLFYEPTLLTGVDHEMACMREETFGPTLPIMKVSDDTEAVRLANDSPYGLSASVWTRSPQRAEQIATRLEVGTVNVNSALMNLFQFRVPMGGWKESGVGSRFGDASGVLKYCRAQSLVVERFRPRSEPQWYPHSRRRARAIARVIRLLGAHDWGRRLAPRGPDRQVREEP